MNTVKMLKIHSFEGTLKVLESGLHIGGTEQIAGIGETDNPIIRHPISHLPYIPGSSVKGKIRSLLEIKHSPMSQNTGKPCSCGKCNVCLLFGCGSGGEPESPTRLIFRDSYPDENTQEKWSRTNIDAELKTEVVMDRKKGSATKGIGPRTTERIPGNSTFEFSFSLRVFEDDDLKDLLNFLAEGFELLEQDYLGGAGSRGYGHVEFITEDGKHMHEYLKEINV